MLPSGPSSAGRAPFLPGGGMKATGRHRYRRAFLGKAPDLTIRPRDPAGEVGNVPSSPPESRVGPGAPGGVLRGHGTGPWSDSLWSQRGFGYTRRSDLARSSADLRVRRLFTRREGRVHAPDWAKTRFSYNQSQLDLGQSLVMDEVEPRLRIGSTGMRLDEGMKLVVAAAPDTVWMDPDTTGEVHFSRPWGPGIWRRTVLERDEFGEGFVSVPGSHLLVLPSDKYCLVAGGWEDFGPTTGADGSMRLRIPVSSSGGRWFMEMLGATADGSLISKVVPL